MALKSGFLHGDLHPGNLFIDSKGLSGCMDIMDHGDTSF